MERRLHRGARLVGRVMKSSLQNLGKASRKKIVPSGKVKRIRGDSHSKNDANARKEISENKQQNGVCKELTIEAEKVGRTNRKRKLTNAVDRPREKKSLHDIGSHSANVNTKIGNKMTTDMRIVAGSTSPLKRERSSKNQEKETSTTEKSSSNLQEFQVHLVEVKVKLLEEFRKVLDRVIENHKNKEKKKDVRQERWDLVLAKLKSLRQGSLREVPEAGLQTLVDIVSERLKDTIPNLYKAPLQSELGISKASTIMDCAQISLHVISSRDYPQRLILSNVLDDIIRTIVNFFEANVCPLYDFSQWINCHVKGVKENRADMKKLWKERENHIRRLFPKALGLIKLLTPLVEKKVLGGHDLDRLLRLSRSLLKINSGKVATMQVATVSLVTTICSIYEKRRNEGLELVIDTWSDLIREEKSKYVKTFPLIATNGTKVQVSTALFLSILQSIPFCSSLSLNEFPVGLQTGPRASERKAVWDRKIKEKLENSIQDFQSKAQEFASRLLQRLTFDMTKCNAQIKNLVIEVIEELLQMLYLPEWPAAEYVILAFAKVFVASLQSRSSTQQLALDALGTICSKVKENMLKADSFLMPEEKKDFDKDGIPTNETEDASCICNGGEKLPQSKKKSMMLDCDSCHRWFHVYCMGLRESQLLDGYDDPEKITRWVCDECQIREEVTRQRSLGDAKFKSSEKLELGEILRILHLNFLTKKPEDLIVRCARQFVLGRMFAWSSQAVKKEDEGDIMDLEEPPVDSTPPQSDNSRLAHYLLQQWQIDSAAAGAVLTREGTIRLIRQLQKAETLSKNCDRILARILKLISDKAPKNRERVLRVLSKVTDKDPSILGLDFVQKVITISIQDVAKLVRSAAIDLVGKCIATSPDISSRYFDVLIGRFNDTGPSVRKKVLKILGSICQKANIPEDRYVQICVHAAEKIFDNQESIRKEVIALFHSLWFAAGKDQKQIAADVKRIVKVIYAAGKNTDHLTEIVKTLIKEQGKPVSQVIYAICECIKDSLVELKEDDKELYFSTMGQLVKTFKFFCDINPDYIKNFAKFLQPNLEFLKTYKTADSKKVKLRAEAMRMILEVIGTSIPTIKGSFKSFFENLTSDLKSILKTEEMSVLRAAVPCISVIAVRDVTYENLLRKMFYAFFNILRRYAREKLRLNPAAKAHRVVIRSLFCVGLFIKYSEFDNEIPEAFNIFSLFCKSEDPLNRRAVISPLFHLFSRDMNSMNKAEDALQEALSLEDTDQMHITILRCLHEFLQGEDDLVDDLQKGEKKLLTEDTDCDDEDEDVDEDFGEEKSSDREDSVLPTVMQHLLKNILKLTTSKNVQVRFYALNVVRTSLKMGLVNPLECISTGICLVSDIDKEVSDDALKLLMFFHEKRPTDLKNRIVQGLEDCFQFQKKTNFKFNPFSNESSSQPFVIGISSLYRLVSSKKQDRDRILKGVVDKMKSVIGLVRDGPSSGADYILKVAFYAVALANLPFDFDEPLLIIFYIRKILCGEGAELYETVRGILDQKNLKSEALLNSVAIQASMFSVLLELVHFIKEAYQLNDSKCESWNPFLTNKASVQRCGRKIEHMYFSLSAIRGQYGSTKIPNPSSCLTFFIKSMENDSLKMNLSYKKRPRKYKKRKKNCDDKT